MNETKAEIDSDRLKRVLMLGFSVLLLIGLHAVLDPFIIPIGWAAVLALAAWPLHRRLLRWMPRFPGLAAFIMVTLIFVMIIGPAAAIGRALYVEAVSAGTEALVWLSKPDATLPGWIVNLPEYGPKAQVLFDEIRAGKETRQYFDEARNHLGQFLSVLTGAAGIIGRTFVQLLLCLFAAFFLFRYGARVVVQVQRVAVHIGGSRFDRLLRAIRATVKGAVYGTVVTAIVQSVLAGVGFYFAKTPVPLLFGLATFVVAFIPFGPPFIYIPLSIVVGVSGPWWHGLLLFLWGVGCISTADNVLRPFFISQATQLPLLLVFFGVLGGVAAFGLIGVFIGPAIIAVAHVLWNEWAQPEVPPTTSEMMIVDQD